MRTVSRRLYPALTGAWECPGRRDRTDRKIHKGDLMPRNIVTTDPSKRPSAPPMDAGASNADRRRQRQIRRMEQRQIRRMEQPKVAAITRVEMVQSYLHLHG
jgi:hypothetical protein